MGQVVSVSVPLFLYPEGHERMNSDLLRLVDVISRDKNIERESIFGDLEEAMASAARKHFGQTEDVEVQIDRETGVINAYLNGEEIDIRKLGRIPAQTAKQVMIQKLREDERGSIFTEYQDRVGEMVSGTIARFESGTLIVNLSRTEALLPRSEQIPGETHHPGERIRGLIYEVKEAPSQVKIILTRTHPDFLRRLFEQEVPEVSERVIEIKGLAREAGYRSKVAVTSIDSKVDAVGACVGIRGSRIKNIVDELGGEKIDIVRWNESSQVLIGNALRPAEVRETALCFELNRATVVVSDDQLSLAIGKRGQNVRLAARLTNWDIDVLTPKEYSEGLETMIESLRGIEKVDDTLIDKIVALGIVSVLDLEEVGVEPLVESLEMSEEMAKQLVAKAIEIAGEIAKKKEQSKATQTVLGVEETSESDDADETGSEGVSEDVDVEIAAVLAVETEDKVEDEVSVIDAVKIELQEDGEDQKEEASS
jgi:N utilization substance protein A